MSEAEILFSQKGSVGLVTLNRPKALNALTHEMCLALDAQLKLWGEEDTIKAVLVEGTGDRAFCAGGDIIKLYEEGRKGADYPYHFYRDEYLLNARIKHFRKPYISLIDGIVMGGGVGVSVHGSHRIATERTLFAMPESGIGLFPDVGGSYFLPRCPGETGMYIGLTGARLKADDAVFVGIANAYIHSEKLGALKIALISAEYSDDVYGDIDDIIFKFSDHPGDAPIVERLNQIGRHFGQDSVEAIIKSLQEDGDDWCLKTAYMLLTKSPTSMKISYKELRRGQHLTFDDCMRMEYRMVNRVIAGVDFYEGTRAAVVHKDQKPVWVPPTLEEVSDANVDAYFAPLDMGDFY